MSADTAVFGEAQKKSNASEKYVYYKCFFNLDPRCVLLTAFLQAKLRLQGHRTILRIILSLDSKFRLILIHKIFIHK